MVKVAYNCFYGFDWKYVNIDSISGLVPDKRPAITWTNEDPVHWRVYASIRLN